MAGHCAARWGVCRHSERSKGDPLLGCVRAELRQHHLNAYQRGKIVTFSPLPFFRSTCQSQSHPCWHLIRSSENEMVRACGRSCGRFTLGDQADSELYTPRAPLFWWRTGQSRESGKVTSQQMEPCSCKCSVGLWTKRDCFILVQEQYTAGKTREMLQWGCSTFGRQMNCANQSDRANQFDSPPMSAVHQSEWMFALCTTGTVAHGNNTATLTS